MLGIFRKSKERKGGKKAVNRAQRRLDEYKPAPEESSPPWVASFREVENEVDNNVKSLHLHIKNIKETSLKIEELTKIFKAGEIPENVYNILLVELSSNLSSLIGEMLRIRENLELLRARAKLEWAKEKIDMGSIFESQSFSKDYYYYRGLPVIKWQDVISKIDSALSSLSFEEELSIIEKYLSIIRDKSSSGGLKETEDIKQICQQRLSVFSEKWVSIRHEKVRKIIDLEARASQLRDSIKEIEVRFAVGEFDKNLYEMKIGQLQGALKSVEKEISDLRNYISEIDQKIFKITELLREDRQNIGV
ncbi:MAG: hypothetical protein QXU02_03450 [Candidatus Bathyarchaeia archaeon]